MLRFVIYAILIGASVARISNHHRPRRNEGNHHQLAKYFRPKYVYNHHEEEETPKYQSYHKPQQEDTKPDYKYYLHVEEEEEQQQPKERHYVHHKEEKEEPVTHYGYIPNYEEYQNTSEDEGGEEVGVGDVEEQEVEEEEEEVGGQKDTKHHVEIKHEHGTSHQSFQMHHFKPARVFIKKEDLHLIKKPIEIGVTKNSFKFVHPKKMKTHNYEIKLESPKKIQFDHTYEDDQKEFHHHYTYKKHETPKYEYHVTKEAEMPKPKIFFQDYVEPKKVEPARKKYDDYIQYSKPKIEYHVPKEYTQHYHHHKMYSPKVQYHVPEQQHFQHYHQHTYSKEPPQKYEHYTTFRGNNDSDEEETHNSTEDYQEKEVSPQDINVRLY